MIAIDCAEVDDAAAIVALNAADAVIRVESTQGETSSTLTLVSFRRGYHRIVGVQPSSGDPNLDMVLQFGQRPPEPGRRGPRRRSAARPPRAMSLLIREPINRVLGLPQIGTCALSVGLDGLDLLSLSKEGLDSIERGVGSGDVEAGQDGVELALQAGEPSVYPGDLALHACRGQHRAHDEDAEQKQSIVHDR